jgi:hypothetical protein
LAGDQPYPDQLEEIFDRFLQRQDFCQPIVDEYSAERNAKHSRNEIDVSGARVTCARFIVFDDAPQRPGHGWTADQFADALRVPLAAIGVRVVRRTGARSNSPMAGLQAYGCSRSQYRAKLNMIDDVVDGVVTRTIAAG